jgi:hypothetical protein
MGVRTQEWGPTVYAQVDRVRDVGQVRIRGLVRMAMSVLATAASPLAALVSRGMHVLVAMRVLVGVWRVAVVGLITPPTAALGIVGRRM